MTGSQDVAKAPDASVEEVSVKSSAKRQFSYGNYHDGIAASTINAIQQ